MTVPFSQKVNGHNWHNAVSILFRYLTFGNYDIACVIVIWGDHSGDFSSSIVSVVITHTPKTYCYPQLGDSYKWLHIDNKHMSRMKTEPKR